MAKAQYLNQKWSEHQWKTDYREVLPTIQQITIETHKGNKYVYRRNCMTSEEDIIPNEWTVMLNGMPFYVADDNGVVIQPPEVKIMRFSDLRTVLESFFDKIDPATDKPHEIPIRCVLN